MAEDGRKRTLAALSGTRSERPPVGLLTWGFDYLWRVAGMAPWELVCGSNAKWQSAHQALVVRHRPDFVFYSGSGAGQREAELLEDTREEWLVRDGNTGSIKRLIKSSLTEIDADTARKPNDPVGRIASEADAISLIPDFSGWGQDYLEGLTGLIGFCGDETLVLPHHSPGYVCACYAIGFVESMAMMIERPDLFLFVADRYAAGDALRMRELADAGAEAVFIADGWASGDIISPAMFRQFALPYQQSMVEAAQSHGLKAILWNEGNIVPMLEDEMGIPWDAFGMEQSRKGVELDLRQLRIAAGPNRCILGNFDSEEVLVRGTEEQIVNAVRDQLDRAGRDQPFLFTTGSPVPSETPPESVDLMIVTVREAGRR